MRQEEPAGGALESWFLTAPERGNEFTELDRRHASGAAWTTGNSVETLVHGATYFRRLLKEIGELGAGDQMFFTDWRSDPDQRLGDGPERSSPPRLVVE